MLSNAQETGTHHFTADMPPFKTQLLKWIGNKQRFAHQIARYFPIRYRTYYEPFLGESERCRLRLSIPKLLRRRYQVQKRRVYVNRLRGAQSHFAREFRPSS